jgi:hypothetical protein
MSSEPLIIRRVKRKKIKRCDDYLSFHVVAINDQFFRDVDQKYLPRIIYGFEAKHVKQAS